MNAWATAITHLSKLRPDQELKYLDIADNMFNKAITYKQDDMSALSEYDKFLKQRIESENSKENSKILEYLKEREGINNFLIRFEF